jgi:hypothetical protein
MVPCFIKVGRIMPDPAWLSGVHDSTRGWLGHSHSDSMITAAAVITRCVWGRHLGLPVVPPE